jgi:putative tricarboxylic transport membrane protein
MAADSCHDYRPAGRAVIPGFRRADFWSGLALAALGAWIVSEARRWEYLGPDGPGAGFFPLWYGIAMVVLAATLVARSVFAKGVDDSRGPLAWAEIRRALSCWCALVVSVALLKIVGFITSFALLSWFIVAVMFRRSQRLAWSIAFGAAVGFYVLFDVVLGVTLPTGIWHFAAWGSAWTS